MDDSPQLTLEAVRKREPDVLAALVHAHHRRLRGFVAILGADLGSVDDLAQEVFLRAFRMLDRVSDLEHFDRFLRAIARNIVKEHLRLRSRHFEKYEDHADRVCAKDPAQERNDSEIMQALRRCLSRLTPKARRMLDLRYTAERPIDEIASEMGLAAGSVRVLLVRIRAALVKCMHSLPGLGVPEVEL